MSCYSEVKGYTQAWTMQKAEGIYDSIAQIIERSQRENIPTQKIADTIAEERITSIGKIKLPL
jgi:leucine dehydrogenase